MNNSLCYITCIFGSKINDVKKSPCSTHSYLFTNNKDLKNLIISKGWKYYYVDKPLLNSSLICSLQSKYIKFLMFLNDFPEFKLNYKKILYCDHKYDLSSSEQIELVHTVFNKYPNHIFIVRGHRDAKRNIKKEIKQSKRQTRYALNLSKTLNYINVMCKQKKCSLKTPVYLTGLIFYNNIEQSLKLTSQVYDLCIKHNQPQCQLYFAIIINMHLNTWTSVPYRHHKFKHIKKK
jgi:hypothetical protein